MWLYLPPAHIPAIFSLCAQASEDLNSESNSPSHIGERLAEASVTSRGKPLPPQAWSRRWKQGGFIRRLSGLTCSPSMLDLGAASFISSLRAIPAKTTALPAGKPVPMATGSLPHKSADWPMSAGLILSSARTCRGTRTDRLKPLSRHWKGWATALRREYSARPQLAIPCAASDCSSWPSARTSGTNGAEKWMAPVASDTCDRTVRYAQGGTPLSMQVRNWRGPVKQWAGPTAQNCKGSSQGSIYRQDGKSRDDLLHYQAEQLFRLPSSPDQPIAAGSMSSTASPNTNQPSVKRKLNPIFVEALMRWPTGLSGFERRETALTR